jgi:hypothetical protein
MKTEERLLLSCCSTLPGLGDWREDFGDYRIACEFLAGKMIEETGAVSNLG